MGVIVPSPLRQQGRLKPLLRTPRAAAQTNIALDMGVPWGDTLLDQS